MLKKYILTHYVKVLSFILFAFLFTLYLPHKNTVSASTELTSEITPETAIETIIESASDSATVTSVPDLIPITLDNSSGASAAQALHLDLLHTIDTTAGAARLLVVGISLWSPVNTIQTVTYNNVTLTRLVQADLRPSYSELWYLKDASMPSAAGTYPVVVNFTAPTDAAIGVTSWVHVNQDSSFGTPASVFGVGMHPSLLLASDKNDVVIGNLTAFGTNIVTPASGQTHLYNLHTGNVQISGSIKIESPTTSLAWTNDGQDLRYGVVGVPLKPLCSTAPPGDFNGDCVVNSNDLTILNNEFGSNCTEEVPCAADMNNDGIVNILDFRIFRQYYLQGNK